MKTRRPLILTARIAENDIARFNQLRLAHFPPDRNVLDAHLTMFHRLPGEYEDAIVAQLEQVAEDYDAFTSDVSGLRHLGAGVAYSITSPALQDIRATLKARFTSWLGSQDMQRWQPHITVQNKASKAKADELYRDLSETFLAHSICIIGLDLWDYLGGPWRHSKFAAFKGPSDKLLTP